MESTKLSLKLNKSAKKAASAKQSTKEITLEKSVLGKHKREEVTAEANQVADVGYHDPKEIIAGESNYVDHPVDNLLDDPASDQELLEVGGNILDDVDSDEPGDDSQEMAWAVDEALFTNSLSLFAQKQAANPPPFLVKHLEQKPLLDIPAAGSFVIFTTPAELMIFQAPCIATHTSDGVECFELVARLGGSVKPEFELGSLIFARGDIPKVLQINTEGIIKLRKKAGDKMATTFSFEEELLKEDPCDRAPVVYRQKSLSPKHHEGDDIHLSALSIPFQ